MSVLEEHFTFVRPEDLAEVRGGQHEAIRDHWWAMRGDEIAFYKGRYPQCNTNRVVSEKISVRYPWYTEVRFIPLVLVAYQTWYTGGEEDRRYQFPKAVAR